VVLDAGMKALDYSSAKLPRPVSHTAQDDQIQYDYSNVEVRNGGDEHTLLVFNDLSTPMPSIGEVVLIVPGHCDPTVNMHDHIMGVRDGRVSVVWDVLAKGPGI
jgi:D-serine deaminase-like pyridoxal phosphate-dependent protein